MKPGTDYQKQPNIKDNSQLLLQFPEALNISVTTPIMFRARETANKL